MYDKENMPRLELRGISKAYPSMLANDRIDLKVMPGEIHAVLGENGAGKSTLMKIIYGVIKPSSGDMLWEGKPVQVDSPSHARSLGIGMVFQHFSLFETLTVTENVALSLPGKPDLADLARRISKVAERYGLPVNPQRFTHALSVGERQRVEIIRCLLQNPNLLIMDEPTSVLTPQAVRKLFATLHQLADEGRSILYISHKLDEIKELCHTATVLRGGRVTGACRPCDETPKSMARLMIGRDLPVCDRGSALVGGPLRLRIDGLSRVADDPFGTSLNNISLDVHAGEIVGIAGISGNGQQELLQALSGETASQTNASVQVCGVAAGRASPVQRRCLGMRFVPEERLGRGAVPCMTLHENALLTSGGPGLVRRGLIDRASVRQLAQDCIDRFDVKCDGPDAQAQSLSGGNLQKFIMGREMLQQPLLLVVSQPTWGVDVGAATFIRQSLIDLRNKGVAVLVVSEELDELFEICDSIAVLARGSLSRPRPVRETNREEIGVWMSGMWSEPPPVEKQIGAAGDSEEVSHAA